MVKNPFQATTIRRGWEWLLTPLMVYQNYHLIHHLYPTIPFYNYLKVPAVQSAFGLTPLDRMEADSES